MRDDLISIFIWCAVFSVIIGLALWTDMAHDSKKGKNDDDDYDYYNHKEEDE